jgi:hypothetical protein
MPSKGVEKSGDARLNSSFFRLGLFQLRRESPLRKAGPISEIGRLQGDNWTR